MRKMAFQLHSPGMGARDGGGGEINPNMSGQLHLTCPPPPVSYRMDEASSPAGVDSEAPEDKTMEEAGQQEALPSPQRRYSLSPALREQRREMRFNR